MAMHTGVIEQLFWKQYSKNPLRLIKFAWSRKEQTRYHMRLAEIKAQAASMLEAQSIIPARNGLAQVLIILYPELFGGYTIAQLADQLAKYTTESRRWITINRKELNYFGVNHE